MNIINTIILSVFFIHLFGAIGTYAMSPPPLACQKALLDQLIILEEYLASCQIPYELVKEVCNYAAKINTPLFINKWLQSLRKREPLEIPLDGFGYYRFTGICCTFFNSTYIACMDDERYVYFNTFDTFNHYKCVQIDCTKKLLSLAGINKDVFLGLAADEGGILYIVKFTLEKRYNRVGKYTGKTSPTLIHKGEVALSGKNCNYRYLKNVFFNNKVTQLIIQSENQCGSDLLKQFSIKRLGKKITITSGKTYSVANCPPDCISHFAEKIFFTSLSNTTIQCLHSITGTTKRLDLPYSKHPITSIAGTDKIVWVLSGGIMKILDGDTGEIYKNINIYDKPNSYANKAPFIPDTFYTKFDPKTEKLFVRTSNSHQKKQKIILYAYEDEKNAVQFFKSFKKKFLSIKTI